MVQAGWWVELNSLVVFDGKIVTTSLKMGNLEANINKEEINKIVKLHIYNLKYFDGIAMIENSFVCQHTCMKKPEMSAFRILT